MRDSLEEPILRFQLPTKELGMVSHRSQHGLYRAIAGVVKRMKKRQRAEEGETGEKEKVTEMFDPFHRPRHGPKDVPYLEQPVEIKDDILRDDAGFAVMMPWEKPLMVQCSSALACFHESIARTCCV